MENVMKDREEALEHVRREIEATGNSSADEYDCVGIVDALYSFSDGKQPKPLDTDTFWQLIADFETDQSWRSPTQKASNDE